MLWNILSMCATEIAGADKPQIDASASSDSGKTGLKPPPGAATNTGCTVVNGEPIFGGGFDTKFRIWLKTGSGGGVGFSGPQTRAGIFYSCCNFMKKMRGSSPLVSIVGWKFSGCCGTVVVVPGSEFARFATKLCIVLFLAWFSRLVSKTVFSNIYREFEPNWSAGVEFCSFFTNNLTKGKCKTQNTL